MNRSKKISEPSEEIHRPDVQETGNCGETVNDRALHPYIAATCAESSQNVCVHVVLLKKKLQKKSNFAIIQLYSASQTRFISKHFISFIVFVQKHFFFLFVFVLHIDVWLPRLQDATMWA